MCITSEYSTFAANSMKWKKKVISEFRVVETGSTSVQPLIILYLLQNEELASMANERGSAEAAQFFLQYQVSLSCVSDYPLWP